MAIRWKVISVSRNYNAFGLRGMVLIGDNGQGWEVAANDINIKAVGDILCGPDRGDAGMYFTSLGFEIPRRLRPDPPAAVVEELFAEPAEPQAARCRRLPVL
jgi:hypothetical protein